MKDAFEIAARQLCALGRAVREGRVRIGAMLWWPSERGRPQVLRQVLVVSEEGACKTD